MQNIIYFLVGSTFNGAYLFKQFMNHKQKSGNIFFKCKK
jgi:hypothetical protein